MQAGRAGRKGVDLARLLPALLLATALGAAEIRAGVARIEGVASALAIDDGRGGRVVFAIAAKMIERPVQDAVAARVEKDYGIERSQLVLSGPASGTHRPFRESTEGLVTAVGAALGDLRPATLAWSEERGAVSIRVGADALFFPADGVLDVRRAAAPDRERALRGPIRTGFRVLDPRSFESREQRTEFHQQCWIQVVRFGRHLTLVLLGGQAPAAWRSAISREFGGGEPLIVLGGNNDPPLEKISDEAAVDAVRTLLKRVGRR